ncbi:MAG: ATP-binding protein [Sphingobacteriales bacterium]
MVGFVRGFTTKKNGTGLGLYNCRTIIESHAGSLEIKSPGPGLGAVSVIRFAM